MSPFARLARVLVRWFGSPSLIEQDRICDYLEEDVPNYRGAWRCYLTLRYYRRGGAAPYPGRTNPW